MKNWPLISSHPQRIPNCDNILLIPNTQYLSHRLIILHNPKPHTHIPKLCTNIRALHHRDPSLKRHILIIPNRGGCQSQNLRTDSHV